MYSTEERILIKLDTIKRLRGYTDERMANLLGCSRQYFQMTRTNKVPLSRKIAQGAKQAFPELKDDVNIFLTGDANIATITEVITTNPLIAPLFEAQRALKGFCVGLLSQIRK